jgi:hypothetical protein
MDTPFAQGGVPVSAPAARLPTETSAASPDELLESLRRLPRYARQLPRSTAELFAAPFPAHQVAQVDPRRMQRFQLIQEWELEASRFSSED